MPIRSLATVSLILLFGCTGPAESLPAAAASRPNIILVMADDLGFETLGMYGGESYETPLSKEDLPAKTQARIRSFRSVLESMKVQ